MELSLIIIGILNVFIVAIAIYKWTREIDFKTTFELKKGKFKPIYHQKKPTLTGSALFLLALINLVVFESMMQQHWRPKQEKMMIEMDTHPENGTGERAILYNDVNNEEDEKQ